MSPGKSRYRTSEEVRVTGALGKVGMEDHEETKVGEGSRQTEGHTKGCRGTECMGQRGTSKETRQTGEQETEGTQRETEDPWHGRMAIRGLWVNKWDPKVGRQMAQENRLADGQMDGQAKVQTAGHTDSPGDPQGERRGQIPASWSSDLHKHTH